MINFKQKAKIITEADKRLDNILSKSYDTFDQYSEISKIKDLEVAKIIIKRLLDKIN